MIAYKETGPQRAANRMLRGVYFLFGSVLLPAGVAMLPASIGIGVMLLVLASLTLLMWWALHERLATPQARRWQMAGMVLSASVVVALMVALLASVQDNSEVPLPPLTIGAVLAAVVLLGVRIGVGFRVRRLASMPPPPLRGAAAELQRLIDRDKQTAHRLHEQELADLGERVRQGHYQGRSFRLGSGGSVTLRIDRHTFWSWYTGSMVAGLPVVIVLSLRMLAFGWWGLVIVVGTVAVMAPLGLLVYELRVRRGLAQLTVDSLRVRTWRGDWHTVPRAAIERVVLVPAELGSMRSARQNLMLFVGANGRCLAHLSGIGIPHEDWVAFAVSPGNPVDLREETMGPDELRREFPGSVSSLTSHQVAFGLALSVVLVLVVTGAVIGWVAATGQLS